MTAEKKMAQVQKALRHVPGVVMLCWLEDVRGVAITVRRGNWQLRREVILALTGAKLRAYGPRALSRG